MGILVGVGFENVYSYDYKDFCLLGSATAQSSIGLSTFREIILPLSSMMKRKTSK